jgi:hypothetical protein
MRLFTTIILFILLFLPAKAQDSTNCVIDGVIQEHKIPASFDEIRAQASGDSIFLLFNHAFPIIQVEDIESFQIASSTTQNCAYSNIVLIKTKEKRGIDEVILDGKYVHKKKKIALGYLADGDTKNLRSSIKKTWEIKQEIKAINLYPEGKLVKDKKGREHLVRIEIITQ